MAEIAFLIIAIALAAFLIALIPTLLRTRHVVKEVVETVAVLRTDINVTLHQTNEILSFLPNSFEATLPIAKAEPALPTLAPAALAFAPR